MHPAPFRPALLAFFLCVSAVSAARAEQHKAVPTPQLAGTYEGVHKQWRDEVSLRPDGTYSRKSGDSGRWTFDGQTLVLGWTKWGPEPLVMRGPGEFEAADHHFKLSLRGKPDYGQVLGTWEGVHRDWRDRVEIRADGTYARGNGDPGTWIFDGRELLLYWRNWGVDTLHVEGPGRIGREGFRLSRAVAQPAPQPMPPPAMPPPAPTPTPMPIAPAPTAGERKPGPVAQLAGTYDGVHRDWRDRVILNADGTYARGNGDPGHWWFDGHTLMLHWNRWGAEPVEFHGPGKFDAPDGHFHLTQQNPPDYGQVIGTYEGKHPSWRDRLEIRADGTFARQNGDGGVWVFNGTELGLVWSKWPAETLRLDRPGKLERADGFRLWREGERFERREPMGEQQPQPPAYAPAPPPTYEQTAPPAYAQPAPPPMQGNRGRFIETDKRVYRAGDVVVVRYHGMPGNSADWTNIAPVDLAPDQWGNWEYTNGQAEGSREVSNVTPGEYEARAYFSTGSDVQDRVRFTVVP